MHELRENDAHHDDRSGRNPNLTLQRDDFGGAVIQRQPRGIPSENAACEDVKAR